MDEDIARWILEYLLRKPIDEKLINGLISLLPLSDSDNRLKKTLLLRRIESEISNGCISEKILDFLELIEELDHRERRTASDSMKSAYCSVAVDCTVRFLEENVEKNDKYLSAVKRVWKERVLKVESLCSDESRRWMDEIESAMFDCEVCGRILMRNTRNDALKKVRVFLKEALENIGPTFLELVAEKFGKSVEAVVGGGEDNPCRDLIPFQEFRFTRTQKSRSLLKKKHVAKKSKRQRGAKLSSADEDGEDEAMNNSKHHIGNEGNKDEPMDKTKAVPTLEVHTAQKLMSAMETDNINSESVVENQTRVDRKDTPEVHNIRKELKASSKDLRALVKDPLLDALETAQTLINIANDQTGSKTHEQGNFTKNDTENGEKKVNPTPDTQESEGQSQRKLRSLPKRSLLEPNSTGHTMQWDDVKDELPGQTPKRPRLASPRETKPSPLKSYNGVNKPLRRRARKAWTQLEEETLKTGVQKFGKGNWKLIFHCYREIFKERTEVDLKDKWRNMSRSS